MRREPRFRRQALKIVTMQTLHKGVSDREGGAKSQTPRFRFLCVHFTPAYQDIARVHVRGNRSQPIFWVHVELTRGFPEPLLTFRLLRRIFSFGALRAACPSEALEEPRRFYFDVSFGPEETRGFRFDSGYYMLRHAVSSR